MMTWCVFVVLMAVLGVEGEFVIKGTRPKAGQTWRVKAGEPTRLSCVSSHTFTLCKWGRPGFRCPAGSLTQLRIRIAAWIPAATRSHPGL